MKPRIHADELASSGGAVVAGRVGARSADHLVHVPPEGIAALARGGVVATLLPCAAFYLKLGRFAPARDLIAAGVPVALATDINPGGGFSPSMPFAMTLACFAMGLTFEEALAAATINGAYSLDRHDRVGQPRARQAARRGAHQRTGRQPAARQRPNDCGGDKEGDGRGGRGVTGTTGTSGTSGTRNELSRVNVLWFKQRKLTSNAGSRHPTYLTYLTYLTYQLEYTVHVHESHGH